MSKESKDLRAKRYKLIEDARALVVGDTLTAEQSQKFNEMMDAADKLKDRIDLIERADEAQAASFEAMYNRSGRNSRPGNADEELERAELENATFRTWMTRGPGALNAEQREIFNVRFQQGQNPQASLGTTPDTAGGYTVPQGFYTHMIDAQLEYGGMLQEGYVFDTATGNPLPIPTDNDTATKGFIIGEGNQVTDSTIPFGAITMNGYTYNSNVIRVANQLLQDTVFDLDAFISDKLGVRIARALNDDLTFGSGASRPTGVLQAATLGWTAGGAANSGSTTSLTFDDIMELEHSVDPAYRTGAKFMFHDQTLKYLKKLKDGEGRPIWLAGLQQKEPDSINGYPYRVNQSMPVMAASAKSIAFGDLKNYFIRRVAGVQILRLTERYADYNQVGFLAFQRWDGNLIDAGTHPVKYLQQSAT